MIFIFIFFFFTRGWGFKESREICLYATVKYYLWSGNVLIEVCFVEMNVFLVKDDIFLYSPWGSQIEIQVGIVLRSQLNVIDVDTMYFIVDVK